MVALTARMGDLELASYQVAHQAMLFGCMPAMAIGDAATVLIGQAVGAGRLRSVTSVQRAALAASFTYVSLAALVYLTLGSLIASQFSHDAAVTTRAAQLMQIGALVVAALPFYSIGQSTIRAIGDVRAASVITVIAAWGCTPLLAVLFGIVLGLGARRIEWQQRSCRRAACARGDVVPSSRSRVRY